MSDALDYAARGETGFNFYGSSTRLTEGWSYAATRGRAWQLARRLLSLGLERHARVAIIAETHPDFVCAFFACQYAGLLAVPLSLPTAFSGGDDYPDQLRRVLVSADASVALAPSMFRGELQRAAEGLGLRFCGFVGELDALPPLEKPSEQPLEPLRAGEPSHIQYSSGSTRYPQGILISQSALMTNARAISRHGLQLGANDRAASWLPFYHDMGLIGFLITPTVCQITVDYLPTDTFARRPLNWLRVISDNQCTVAFSPTFGYQHCMRRASKVRNLSLDLSSWRIAGIGGEMVRPDVVASFASYFAPYGFREAALLSSYGLAEMTLGFSFSRPGSGVSTDRVEKGTLVARQVAQPPQGRGGASAGPDLRVHSNGEEVHLNGRAPSGGNGSAAAASARDVRDFVVCGAPLPGHEVEVRDSAGNRRPDRCVGRIFIKGPSLMSGYYRDPEATASVMGEDGWLDSGDMGYLVDGQLVITGRAKDLIIVNGRNIWPQDLEWHAEAHVEGVRSHDCAAICVEEDNQERAVMLVQCRLQDDGPRESLRQRVHAAVSHHTGVNCQVVLLGPHSLPFTSSGKLSRQKAKADFLAGLHEEVSRRQSESAMPMVGQQHGGRRS